MEHRIPPPTTDHWLRPQPVPSFCPMEATPISNLQAVGSWICSILSYLALGVLWLFGHARMVCRFLVSILVARSSTATRALGLSPPTRTERVTNTRSRHRRSAVAQSVPSSPSQARANQTPRLLAQHDLPPTLPHSQARRKPATRARSPLSTPLLNGRGEILIPDSSSIVGDCQGDDTQPLILDRNHLHSSPATVSSVLPQSPNLSELPLPEKAQSLTKPGGAKHASTAPKRLSWKWLFGKSTKNDPGAPSEAIPPSPTPTHPKLKEKSSMSVFGLKRRSTGLKDELSTPSTMPSPLPLVKDISASPQISGHKDKGTSIRKRCPTSRPTNSTEANSPLNCLGLIIEAPPPNSDVLPSQTLEDNHSQTITVHTPPPKTATPSKTRFRPLHDIEVHLYNVGIGTGPRSSDAWELCETPVPKGGIPRTRYDQYSTQRPSLVSRASDPNGGGPTKNSTPGNPPEANRRRSALLEVTH